MGARRRTEPRRRDEDVAGMRVGVEEAVRKSWSNMTAANCFATAFGSLRTGINDMEVTKGEGGLITMTPTEPGLQHRVAAPSAPPSRRCGAASTRMGTTEANIVRQGTRPHPGAVAGLAGHRAAQGTHRQDGAADLPRGAPASTAEEAKPTRVAGRLQGLSSRDKDEGAQLSAARRRSCAATSWSTRSPASTSAPTSRSSPSASTMPGARKFGNFTKDNVGRPFAIVLDDKVISAPVIREPILGGSRPDQRQLHGRDRQRSSPSSSAPARCRPS